MLLLLLAASNRTYSLQIKLVHCARLGMGHRSDFAADHQFRGVRCGVILI